MKVALVAIVKQEQNLVEWCRYHYALGFSKIFLYANDWMPDYALPNSVIVTPIAGQCRQIEAYNSWIKVYGRHFDYVAFFDADEYLYLNKHKTIQEYLKPQMRTVCFNWVFFGSISNGNPGVVRRFTNRQAGVDKHVKVILKLGLGYQMKNPHFADCVAWTPEGQPIKQMPFNNDGSDQIAFIAHYWTQDKDYFQTKISRGRADTGSKFNHAMHEWDAYNLTQNEINDNRLKEFYERQV